VEKRSRRRIRDLVTQLASQGLWQNEIGCARISMMAKSTNALFTGRIQKRKTNPLQSFTFGLQHTAGPYNGSRNSSKLPFEYLANHHAGLPVACRAGPQFYDIVRALLQ
jgi:hypothetical protein